MKCSCGDKDCESRLDWDTGSHTVIAIHSYNRPEQRDMEVLLYYDANSLVELIKEAKVALIELTGEVQ